MVSKIKIFLIFLLLTSCKKTTTLSFTECESLNYGMYRGDLYAKSQFNLYCQNYQILDVSATCNNALADMTMGVVENKLKMKWGDDIFQCFHESTLKKYLVKSFVTKSDE